MPDEQLFTVSGHTAASAAPIGLADAGLRERDHLQAWIIANPRVLGDDVLIVTCEFDRWATSVAGNADPRDRLDILGLDPAGTLVVVELKRDRAASTVEMQALKYAAMASRFDVDTLAAAYAAHRTRSTGATTDNEEALALLEEHAGGELDPKVLRRPKVVLVAGEFAQTTTATCVWLSEMGIDVTLVRYQAYRTDSGVVLTTSQLWPIPTVEDFTVSPRISEARQVAKTQEQRRRATSAVSRIVAADGLEPDSPLTLRPTNEVDADTRVEIEAWVAEEPSRGRAIWTGQGPAALRWEADGRDYAPTSLARIILKAATGIERGMRGPSWWVTEDGDDLVAIADEVAPTKGSPSTQPRDWSDLHELLAQLPDGSWTTYGDVAEQIGSSAIAVGQHVTRCEDGCIAAWRVLGANGRPREGFRWGDPTVTDTAQEVLEREGVRFDEVGRADPAQRFDWTDPTLRASG